MGLSSTEATAMLAGIESIESLRDLIRQIDVSATGSLTIFYSGDALSGRNYGDVARELAANQSDLRILDATQVADFLDVDSNTELKRSLERLVGGNPLEEGTSSYNFLNGVEDANGNRIANGIWDEVSARFAQETVGEVRVLTSPKKEFGVFALSELPVLLVNEGITSIDGLPREQLIYLRDSQGIEMVKHAVAANAFAQIDLSRLMSGGLSEYRNFDVSELGDLLKDDGVRAALFDKLTALDPQSTVNLETGLSALRQAGEICHLKGIARTLNRVGYVGGLLSFMLVSAQASAAPTRTEAEAIMKAWAVEAAGSEVGAIIAGTAAGIAVAAFAAAVTPVAVPVAVALTLGASLLGGFFGAEWAGEFHGMLDGRDDGQRREILDRLTSVYFGEATAVDAKTLPSMESNFLRVDPALSAEAMLQAAKSSLSWRYALVKLNPFVVPDADYQTLHNSNDELELFDSTTREGLTDDYLQARAEALHTFAGLFAAGVQVGSARPYPGGHDIHFMDAELLGKTGIDDAVLDLHYTSDFKEQRLFGAAGDDVLIGSTAGDMLFGADGNDRLNGKGGSDYLEGGAGDDIYLAGDGDRIFDHDGIGRVLFDHDPLFGAIRDATDNTYDSVDGRYRYTLRDGELRVRRTAGGASLTISNFRNGDLGIDLDESRRPPPSNGTQTIGSAGSEVIYGQTDPGVTDYEQVDGYNLPDHIQGHAGRDWIYAWDSGPQTIENGVVINSAADTDIVEGGSGKDLIHGGAGDDKLYATEIVDADAVRAGQGSMAYGGSSIEEGDFVSGQSGNDELYGSGRVDGLFGGDGDDLIYGGGGDDVIAGDWSVIISTLSLNPATYNYDWYAIDSAGNRELNLAAYRPGNGEDRIYAGDGDDLVWGGAADDIIHGQIGDDQLNGDISGIDAQGNAKLPGQYHGDDFVSGGEGDDAINGNGGSDVLFGGAGNDVLDGDFRVLIGDDATYHGDDYLDGGAGADILTGNGGADVLLGGDDGDVLFGDLDGLDAGYHGADVLYGNAGNDQLVGQGGDDTLHGGSDDDILYGDDLDLFILSGKDALFGGAGSDQLSGGLGDDVLSGGEGRDDLWGDPGDDRLSGGQGLDYLEGGAGADVYIFSAGDSPAVEGELETIVDLAGQGNRIEFSSDVIRGSLEFTLTGDSSDLILQYSATDAIYVSGGLTGSIGAFSFAGATPVSYQTMLQSQIPNARYLDGGAGDDLVFGSGENDVLEGGAGDDRLLGGDGNDLLNGEGGTNRLVGGAGADTYLMSANPVSTASGLVRNYIVDSLDRSSTVRFGVGIEPTDINMQFVGSTVIVSAGTQVLFLTEGAHGDLVNRFEFSSGDVLSFHELKTLHEQEPNSIVGTAGDDVLNGTPGNDSIAAGTGSDDISSGAGSDRLDGGAGADVMAGGTGYDTYVVDHPGDSVIETELAGYDFVLSSVDYTLPEHVEGLELTGSDPVSGTGNSLGNHIVGNSGVNRLSGGDGDDRIEGGGGLDVIHGGAGNDRLEGRFQIFGGAGDDHIASWTDALDGLDPIYELAGGPGDDLYQISQPQHMWGPGTIIEHAGEGVDTLVLHADVMILSEGLPDHVENLRYDYSGDIWFADGVLLVGNGLDNRIEIGRPNPGSTPRLEGLAGDDVLIGSDLDESGSDRAGLFGGDGNDRLHGMGGNDRLDGGAGDDILDGGAGADRLSGGSGRDTYVFSLGDSSIAQGTSVIDDLDGDSVIHFGNDIGPEDLRFEAEMADLIVGYSSEDAFVVKGGAQAAPIAAYAFASGAVFSQDQLDLDLKDNSPPHLFGVVPEITALEGRPHAVTLPADLFSDPDGDALDYRLVASDGSPLPVWLGFDPVTLGLQVDAADGDAGVYELELSATDPEGESATTRITVDIADVAFSAGGDSDDVVKGTAAPDNLNAGSGDDRLYGFAGDDWLLAGEGADTLFGGLGDDLLIGGAGNDILNGQAGDDEMAGGSGDDRYYLDSPEDTLFEALDAGLDRVYSRIDHRLGRNFEDLVLLGDAGLAGFGHAGDNRLYGNAAANELHGEAGDDRLYGRAGNDHLVGGAGNDILNGQAGDDRMIGGEGDDRYYLDAPGDRPVESADEGVDRVYTLVEHRLGTHFEDLVLQGTVDLIGIGNAGDNRLFGNVGSNELRGESGDDRMYGRDGNDQLIGGAGNDILSGQSGNDELLGGEGDDRLYGGEGDDIMFGGTGDDLLDGGSGSDEYHFGRGDGADRIRSSAGRAMPTDSDLLRFDQAVSPEQLWFSRSGQDLLAQIMGTTDLIRVSGWYSDEVAPIGKIVAGEGELILADQVEQLVNAMAVFGVPRAPVIELSSAQHSEFSAVVAAYWEAPATLSA